MKLLEEKLELVEAENSDLTKKYFDAETRLYEAESRCRNNNDNNNNNDKSNCDESSSKDVKQEMVNANQTIDVLMKLLNSNKGQLLSCHRKVKNFEQESSDIKAKLSRKNKKISKLSGNLQETEHRLKLNLEQLDSAKIDLGFCKTAAMDTEAEKIELEAELKTALDKIDDVSKECRVPGTEGFGWTENNGADSLDSCLKKFEKEIHMEREKIWEKAWQKQDYSMCVRTCDMMRTAACKLAFNFLPFKGYLLECD